MAAFEETSQNGIFKGKVKFPYFVLLLFIILTIGTTLLFYQSAKSKDNIRFHSNVSRIRFSLENNINLNITFLKAGRGFIETSKDLDHKKFSNFVESLELEKNYFGAQEIGYTKTIRSGEGKKLTAAMRAEGFESFNIFPESEKEFYQPIIYIEPLNERNKRAVGFDMSTEENRRTAMERARDTGIASLTAKVTLIQETEQDRQFGFLIYLPIYKTGELSETVEDKRQNLQGYIYSRFRAKNFLRDVQDNADINNVAIKIFDSSSDPENLLAHTEDIGEQNLAGQIKGEYSTTNEIEVGGRLWIIQYDSLQSFAIQSSVNWTPLIFLSGLIFSLMLFGMTYWETSTRAKLRETASDLSESEQQIQGLLEKEQEARRNAETANITKDEFISVVSHELRTPLNAIAGWTRILKSDDLSKNTKVLALQKIEKNLRLQTTLVEDLLNYSQLVASQENLDKIEIDYSRMFETVFLEIEPVALKKGISIIRDNRLNGQKILGDAEKVKIVFINLLANALKFTPFGGKITIKLWETENCLELVIEDSGRGIDPEFLPHIFDRFSQYDSSITRKFGGFGLGLAVSKHIVKLHNGSIEAKSEGEGKGSKFSLRFPLYLH